MKFQFYKYSATGNDFIIVDNRKGEFSLEKSFWASLCARNTGIGADGVLLVENHPSLDFSMRYLNADGGEVSMCGNGARAISHFCHHVLKLKFESHYQFMTKAGEHHSWVEADKVKIKLPEVKDVGTISLEGLVTCRHHLFANTGVPHAVFEVGEVDSQDVQTLGARVRYNPRFKEGSNANFYEVVGPSKIRLRTYERGVEGETLACGTGAVASAVCFHHFHPENNNQVVEIETYGGVLFIELASDLSWATLEGEVRCLFKGEVL